MLSPSELRPQEHFSKMNERALAGISRANARRFRKPLPVTEAHVQQTVVEYLQLDGWRAIRTDPVSDRARGKGFGEVGMPDYLFVRYFPHPWEWHHQESPGDPSWHPGAECQADVLWIEFKRPGQKPGKHQLAWHEAERARGALVLVVDDIDKFVAFYKASGLARRVR